MVQYCGAPDVDGLLHAAPDIYPRRAGGRRENSACNSIHNKSNMDSENNTAAAPKRPYIEDSDNSDDQSISQQFRKHKQKKSKKPKKPKKPKGEETVAEETADEPNLSVEIVQVGPCPRDFYNGPENAIEALRKGERTVAAFLLRNDDVPDQNGTRTASVQFHQSIRHHFTTDALSRLEKLGEKVASNMAQGEYTKKKRSERIAWCNDGQHLWLRRNASIPSKTG